MNPLAHDVLLPVLLPMVTAALLVVVPDTRRRLKAGLHLLSMLASLAVAVHLLLGLDAGTRNAMAVYLPGNWPVPFGIVLALDRLSAMMLVLAALVGVGSLVFALARWHRASVHFHPLLQLQLAGLNGAFLTADLFNLFVFFEVLLAASYGLLLHGGGSPRVRAGLHYIAVNLVASLLFLAGAALLYGVTGTLTMADIAQKLPQVPAADRGLLHAAAALLAVAFLAKAALWPLNFWLPTAYAAASAPAAAMFALLTKVGVYAILRLWTLCFPATAGDSAHFGGVVLVAGGLATVAFGAIGMLRSVQLGRLAGYSVITSSGTVIAAVGFDLPALTTGALFYLASSTLAAATLFLLVEVVERQRQLEVDPPEADQPQGRLPAFADVRPPADANLDDDQVALVGRAIPGAIAFLGTAFFACMLVVAGLPPLSGFVGKLAMLTALAGPEAHAPHPRAAWLMFALLLGSGFLATLSLTRAFITHFWATQERAAPRLRLFEGVPILLLLGGCIAMAVAGEHGLRFARAMADDLHAPQGYIDAVMATRPQTREAAR
ncbi:monovalent cation/H+ antiporter subunit D [Ramlibacter sp.]|uniref:monovalent cation/H+ antiporter subunit D n=1 Tax=Ramlibacter sp. TaxID=1917967 RepID=UPI003D13625F